MNDTGVGPGQEKYHEVSIFQCGPVGSSKHRLIPEEDSEQEEEEGAEEQQYDLAKSILQFKR